MDKKDYKSISISLYTVIETIETIIDTLDDNRDYEEKSVNNNLL